VRRGSGSLGKELFTHATPFVGIAYAYFPGKPYRTIFVPPYEQYPPCIAHNVQGTLGSFKAASIACQPSGSPALAPFVTKVEGTLAPANEELELRPTTSRASTLKVLNGFDVIVLRTGGTSRASAQCVGHVARDLKRFLTREDCVPARGVEDSAFLEAVWSGSGCCGQG
jgi:hypothetical protein